MKPIKIKKKNTIKNNFLKNSKIIIDRKIIDILKLKLINICEINKIFKFTFENNFYLYFDKNSLKLFKTKIFNFRNNITYYKSIYFYKVIQFNNQIFKFYSNIEINIKNLNKDDFISEVQIFFNYLKLKINNKFYLFYNKNNLMQINIEGINNKLEFINKIEKIDNLYKFNLNENYFKLYHFINNRFIECKFNNVNYEYKFQKIKKFLNYYLITIDNQLNIYNNKTFKIIKNNFFQNKIIENFVIYDSYILFLLNNKKLLYNKDLKLVNLDIENNYEIIDIFNNFIILKMNKIIKTDNQNKFITNYNTINKLVIDIYDIKNLKFLEIKGIEQNKRIINEIYEFKKFIIILINDSFYQIYNKNNFNLINLKNINYFNEIKELYINDKENYIIIKNVKNNFFFYNISDLSEKKINGIKENIKIIDYFILKNEKNILYEIIKTNDNNFYFYKNLILVPLNNINNNCNIKDVSFYDFFIKLNINYNYHILIDYYFNNLNDHKIIKFLNFDNYFILKNEKKEKFIYDNNFNLIKRTFKKILEIKKEKNNLIIIFKNDKKKIILETINENVLNKKVYKNLIEELNIKIDNSKFYKKLVKNILNIKINPNLNNDNLIGKNNKFKQSNNKFNNQNNRFNNLNNIQNKFNFQNNVFKK